MNIQDTYAYTSSHPEFIRQLNYAKEWIRDAKTDGWTPDFDGTAEVQDVKGCLWLISPGIYIKSIGIEIRIRANVVWNYPFIGFTVWGPDQRIVAPPYPYNRQELVKNLQYCSKCGRYDARPMKTRGFADRVCRSCFMTEEK